MPVRRRQIILRQRPHPPNGPSTCAGNPVYRPVVSCHVPLGSRATPAYGSPATVLGERWRCFLGAPNSMFCTARTPFTLAPATCARDDPRPLARSASHGPSFRLPPVALLCCASTTPRSAFGTHPGGLCRSHPKAQHKQYGHKHAPTEGGCSGQSVDGRTQKRPSPSSAPEPLKNVSRAGRTAASRAGPPPTGMPDSCTQTPRARRLGLCPSFCRGAGGPPAT